MPLYEYECHSDGCREGGDNAHDFTASVKMEDRATMPVCDQCGDNDGVKKVIKTAFPKSRSWSL